MVFSGAPYCFEVKNKYNDTFQAQNIGLSSSIMRSRENALAIIAE